MDDATLAVKALQQIAKGPPELCFLWRWPCFSSSEWAAWVQAVGSVVGIAIAVWLPYQAKRKADAEAQSLAVNFVVGAFQIIHAMDQMARSGDARSVQVKRAILDEHMLIGRTVPLHQIAPAVMKVVVTIRAACAEILLMTQEDRLKQDEQISMSRLAETLSEYRHDFAAMMVQAGFAPPKEYGY